MSSDLQLFNPDFLITGAQKAGTTAHRYILKSHPDIFIPNSELQYFDDKRSYSKDISVYQSAIKYHWDRELPRHDIYKFRDRRGIIGEKTPTYCLGSAVERIYTHYPNIKLIIVLREPVARAFSGWNMDTQNPDHQYYNKPFTDIIDLEIGWDISVHAVTRPGAYYLTRGYYYDQIQHILKFFDREQLYIAIAEKLRPVKVDVQKITTYSDRNCEQYKKILKFLNVNTTNIRSWFPEKIGYKPSNVLNYKSSICKKDKERLIELFKPHNEKLFNFLGYEIEEWKYEE